EADAEDGRTPVGQCFGDDGADLAGPQINRDDGVPARHRADPSRDDPRPPARPTVQLAPYSPRSIAHSPSLAVFAQDMSGRIVRTKSDYVKRGGVQLSSWQ